MVSWRALLVAIVSLAMVFAPHFGRWPGIAPDGASVAAASGPGDPSGSPEINVVAADDDDDDNDDGDNDDKDDDDSDDKDDDDDGGSNGKNDDDDDDGDNDEDDDGSGGGDDDDDDNGDGDDDDGGDGDDDNGDGDDDDSQDGGAGRQPVTARVAPGAGAAGGGLPTPQNEASASVATGGQLNMALEGATVAVRNPLPGAVQINLKRVDPGSVPAPPGGRVGSVVFDVSAGGGAFPHAVNLGVSYSDAAAAGLNEAGLVLARLEGGQWMKVPSSVADPPSNFVSATIDQGGTYAVFQS